MRLLALLVALAAAFSALPVRAADHVVTAFAGPFRFEPADLTIAPGDTVTFVNGGGFHNVVSDPGAIVTFRCAEGCDGDGAGGNGDASSSNWSATVAFPEAGVAPYFCEIHGAPGGVGMSGVITVAEEVPTPVLVVEPVALEGTADAGASVTVAFGIANEGTAALDWTADTAETDCASPGLVPWLSLDPAAGTIGIGGPAVSVDVTLDAAALDVGVYSANVCVGSNDPANALLTLPVTFTVNTPDVVFADGFDG